MENVSPAVPLVALFVAGLYFLALFGASIVLLSGFRGVAQFLKERFTKTWKFSLLLLFSLAGLGFFWGHHSSTFGTLEYYCTITGGALFHLAGMLLVVYLFVFVPLKIFKINRSESSLRFVKQLNYVLFPFATVYMGGLIFLAAQFLIVVLSYGNPVVQY